MRLTNKMLFFTYLNKKCHLSYPSVKLPSLYFCDPSFQQNSGFKTFLLLQTKPSTAKTCLDGLQLTWVDVTFYNMVDYLTFMAGDPSMFVLAMYPKLKALRTKVETHPAIAAWIAKRPNTDF